MDFREYEITRDGDDVVVSGTIREPVNWDFTIRMTGDDIPGMLRLGLHRHTLAMAARWAIRRRAKAPATPVTPPRAAPVTPPRATPVTPPRAAPGTPAPVPRGTPAPAVRETPAAPARSPRMPVTPHEVPPEPELEPRDPVPKTGEPAPQPRPTSGAGSQTGTADFGAPRRRGGANGGRASVTDAAAEGERR